MQESEVMSTRLESMGDNINVIIIGASGGIGAALLTQLNASPQVAQIFALSRQARQYPSPKIHSMAFDFTDETSVESAAANLKDKGPFDLVILATGHLHGPDISPEKSMRAISIEGFEKNFAVNTIGPALTAKYILPLMRRDQKSVFSALSARVGSISDNRIGGWYAYRASKAALNMVLKTLAIEHGRRFKDCVIIGLHPGTVDTPLSKPFQGNVPEGKLFTAEDSASKLLSVIDNAAMPDSGHLIDWAGQKVPF